MKMRMIANAKLRDGREFPAGEYEVEITNEGIVVIDATGDSFRIGWTRAHKYFNEVMEPPTFEELEEFVSDGVSDSVFGERVEPDGYDERGGPSWLMAMGNML